MAKKINPYPLIDVFEASKIPPINAQQLLDSFKSLLENFGNLRCRLREGFLDLERRGEFIAL